MRSISCKLRRQNQLAAPDMTPSTPINNIAFAAIGKWKDIRCCMGRPELRDRNIVYCAFLPAQLICKSHNCIVCHNRCARKL